MSESDDRRTALVAAGRGLLTKFRSKKKKAKTASRDSGDKVMNPGTDAVVEGSSTHPSAGILEKPTSKRRVHFVADEGLLSPDDRADTDDDDLDSTGEEVVLRPGAAVVSSPMPSFTSTAKRRHVTNDDGGNVGDARIETPATALVEDLRSAPQQQTHAVAQQTEERELPNTGREEEPTPRGDERSDDRMDRRLEEANALIGRLLADRRQLESDVEKQTVQIEGLVARLENEKRDLLHALDQSRVEAAHLRSSLSRGEHAPAARTVDTATQSPRRSSATSSAPQLSRDSQTDGSYRALEQECSRLSVLLSRESERAKNAESERALVARERDAANAEVVRLSGELHAAIATVGDLERAVDALRASAGIQKHGEKSEENRGEIAELRHVNERLRQRAAMLEQGAQRDAAALDHLSGELRRVRREGAHADGHSGADAHSLSNTRISVGDEAVVATLRARMDQLTRDADAMSTRLSAAADLGDVEVQQLASVFKESAELMRVLRDQEGLPFRDGAGNTASPARPTLSTRSTPTKGGALSHAPDAAVSACAHCTTLVEALAGEKAKLEESVEATKAVGEEVKAWRDKCERMRSSLRRMTEKLAAAEQAEAERAARDARQMVDAARSREQLEASLAIALANNEAAEAERLELLRRCEDLAARAANAEDDARMASDIHRFISQQLVEMAAEVKGSKESLEAQVAEREGLKRELRARSSEVGVLRAERDSLAARATDIERRRIALVRELDAVGRMALDAEERNVALTRLCRDQAARVNSLLEAAHAHESKALGMAAAMEALEARSQREQDEIHALSDACRNCESTIECLARELAGLRPQTVYSSQSVADLMPIAGVSASLSSGRAATTAGFVSPHGGSPVKHTQSTRRSVSFAPRNLLGGGFGSLGDLSRSGKAFGSTGHLNDSGVAQSVGSLGSVRASAPVANNTVRMRSTDSDGIVVEGVPLSVGARVELDGGRMGSVRYIGPVQFAKGTWIGIALDSKGAGKHDGTVGDVRYFDCDPAQGVFVKRPKVARVVDQSVPQRNT